MQRKLVILSGLVFSGAIAFNGTPGWSQTGGSSGSSGAAGQESSEKAKSSQKGSAGSSAGSTQDKSGSSSGAQMDRSTRSSGDTGGQSSARGMSGQSNENVKQVQEALKTKGHDPGAPDGVMGPKTQQALRAFQKQNGLQATGRLDDKTASALGVDASGSGKA